MPRARPLFALLVVALGLAACGPLPHPFRAAGGKASNALAELAVDVRVAPVTGLDEVAAGTLARAVAMGLGGFGVTATSRADAASRFVLDGTLDPTGGDAGAPYDALIQWTLMDGAGAVVGLHAQGVNAAPTDWQPAAPGFLRVVGAEAAGPIAALVGVDADAAAAEPPRRLWVAGVSGAPGDGNEALARAIRAALRGAGVTLAEDRAGAAYVLAGRVAVDAPAGAEQRIDIRWTVSRSDGAPVGEAAQSNAVPAGSLDDKWGRLAGLAAVAAVEGIEEVLRRAETPAPGAVIAVPSAPDLPAPPARPSPPPAAGTQ